MVGFLTPCDMISMLKDDGLVSIVADNVLVASLSVFSVFVVVSESCLPAAWN